MWEMLAWPPRTPRSAWVFVLLALGVALLALPLLFLLPSTPRYTDDELQLSYDHTLGSALSTSLVEQLAKAGYPVAQLELGERCLAGIELPKDEGQALRWMKAASDQGYARAHHRFALFYDEVLKQHGDPRVSSAYHLRAARAGEPNSQYVVGLRYLKGEGLPLDRIEAYAWLNLAAVHSLPAYKAREELAPGKLGGLTPDELAQARVRSLLLLEEIKSPPPNR
jgi:TPR repeat protein